VADTKTAAPGREKPGKSNPSDQVKRVLPASDVPKPLHPALVIDASALGCTFGFEDRVIWLTDWLNARTWCRCPLEDQKLGPCVPQRTRWVNVLDGELRITGVRAERYDPRERTANYRQTFPEDRDQTRRRGALDRVHDYCDESEKWVVASELSRQRHGAWQPWSDCAGCDFSLLGELEPDRSLVAAYTPHGPGQTAGLERMPHQDKPVRFVDELAARQKSRERERLDRLRRSMPTPGKAEPQRNKGKEPKPRRKGKKSHGR